MSPLDESDLQVNSKLEIIQRCHFSLFFLKDFLLCSDFNLI